MMLVQKIQLIQVPKCFLKKSTNQSFIYRYLNIFFLFNRNNCVSPINQLLCTLRYYATGCFQTTGGDLCGFSSSTVNRIVHKVSYAIALLRSQYIHFPDNPEEIKRTQLEFYRRAKFPRVVGAIDCTHIKLWQSPGNF